MKSVLQSKTNKDETIEIFPLLLLKTPYTVYAHVQGNSQKRSVKGSNFREDDSAFPSRSYYSMQYTAQLYKIFK